MQVVPVMGLMFLLAVMTNHMRFQSSAPVATCDFYVRVYVSPDSTCSQRKFMLMILQTVSFTHSADLPHCKNAAGIKDKICH